MELITVTVIIPKSLNDYGANIGLSDSLNHCDDIIYAKNALKTLSSIQMNSYISEDKINKSVFPQYNSDYNLENSRCILAMNQKKAQ